MSLMGLFKRWEIDQAAIWTSPARLRWRDMNWLVPLGGATAGLLAIDNEMGKRLSDSPAGLDRSRRLSTLAVASLAGAGGGLYLWSRITRDAHKREAGVLSGEALVNALAFNTTLQYATGRGRPLSGSASGKFYRGGNSFPSNHAAAAWSVASVLTHEYPGPLTKILAYGLASAVSVSRVTSKQHFPSDAFLGSAIGWFAGRQIYRAHHDPELGGGVWGNASIHDEESDGGPRSIGSPYVSLDSWVYTAINRLSGLGYVNTALSGIRPWTRSDCARLVEEAGDSLAEIEERDQSVDALAGEYYALLQREFSFELSSRDGRTNRAIRIESIYARALSISGPPLTDGFHFGQTISYDFGRPTRRGLNAIAGSAVSGSYGPFFFLLGGEYQHSTAAPALADGVRNIVALRDSRPIEAALPFAAIHRPTLLDSYVGVNFRNWQLTFGKQSLEWGPGVHGGLLFSANPEPLYMVRLTNARPLELPGLLHYFGLVRLENIVAQPRGRAFIPLPYIFGQKIIIKPVRFLELGFSRTVTLGGKGGDPVTAGNFYRGFFGRQGDPNGPGVPGDSRSSFDWTLRVPGLRGRLILYSDLFADDDEFPLVNPPRATVRPGLWVTRVPKIPKLDLHVEAASSESPGFTGNRGNLNYFNFLYRDGYTNNGSLIGNTVGRQGTALQAWSAYSFSATSSLQFGFKNSTVDPAFIPGGGNWQDYSIRHEKYLPSGLAVTSFLQVEYIRNYPILFNGSRKNVSASIEIRFLPGMRKP
jgi:membrane-associated phospholipid phosphatase